MQSSFSVIKNKEILQKDIRTISTCYESESFNTNKNTKELEDLVVCDEEKNEILKSYETIGETIIKDAKAKKEKILSNAYEDARKIEKEAYQKGYDEGLSNGYEDGYKDSYDKNIVKAQKECEQLLENASNTLKYANQEYDNFMENKKDEIINLAFDIAEKILKIKIKNEGSITAILEDAISNAKGCKSLLIRCNSVHEEDIKKILPKWNLKYAIKNDIFLLNDDNLSEGNAVIEKEDGKINVGIDVGLQILKTELLKQED